MKRINRIRVKYSLCFHEVEGRLGYILKASVFRLNDKEVKAMREYNDAGFHVLKASVFRLNYREINGIGVISFLRFIKK